MGMWYNYTFPRDDSANARCCPRGNNTNLGDWSFCTVEVGNGSDPLHSVGSRVNDCFVFKQNVTDLRLYLHDYAEHAPKSAAASSTAPRSFGVLSFVLLALSLASLTLAQDQAPLRVSSTLGSAWTSHTAGSKTDQNQELNVYLDYQNRWENEMRRKYGAQLKPLCTCFEPDDASTWNLDGDMPPMVVGDSGHGDDRGGAGSMRKRPWNAQHWYLNVTWRAEVPVTGNWTALEKMMRSAIPDDRMERLKKEVYVPYVGDMLAWPGLPRSMYGEPAVSTAAVIIPGTFSERINITDPTHRGNVTVPYWDRLFYFTHMELIL